MKPTRVPQYGVRRKPNTQRVIQVWCLDEGCTWMFTTRNPDVGSADPAAEQHTGATGHTVFRRAWEETVETVEERAPGKGKQQGNGGAPHGGKGRAAAR
ncbi:hypothetical protein [Streptomyces formicae]